MKKSVTDRRIPVWMLAGDDNQYRYRIRPNYRTVRLGFFKLYWEHSFVLKYAPAKGTL